MSHFLPVEEIQKDLQSAVDQFRADSEKLKGEEERLEKEILEELEKKKIDTLKKKLYA